MARNSDLSEAPQLPPACVDFNALHDAAKRGDAAGKALAAALVTPESEIPPAAPAVEPAPPASAGQE